MSSLWVVIAVVGYALMTSVALAVVRRVKGVIDEEVTVLKALAVVWPLGIVIFTVFGLLMLLGLFGQWVTPAFLGVGECIVSIPGRVYRFVLRVDRRGHPRRGGSEDGVCVVTWSCSHCGDLHPGQAPKAAYFAGHPFCSANCVEYYMATHPTLSRDIGWISRTDLVVRAVEVGALKPRTRGES